MSCGEHDDLIQSMAYNMAAQIDNKVYTVYTTPTSAPTVGAVGSSGWTAGTGTGPMQGQYAYPDTRIQMGNGILTTDNTGGLMWNDYTIAPPGERMKNSVRNLTEMLKDDTLKKIVLCKSKEECKEEFGKYGLEIYDSLLKDVLEAGIKSEETFNSMLREEQEKVGKLRQYILDNVKLDEDKKRLEVDVYKLIHGI